MRPLFGFLAAVLVGCGGASAEVDGSAGGVEFGKTNQVYFGGPFIIISMLELDCEDVDYVRRNYEIGLAPTDSDTQLIQFSFDEDTISEGDFPVDIDAAVSSSVVKISGGAFTETVASGGLLTVDSFEDEDHVDGTFDGITFEDGTVSGEFSAVWCRNLKAK
jgi:hypothetical protein